MYYMYVYMDIWNIYPFISFHVSIYIYPFFTFFAQKIKFKKSDFLQ